MQLVLFDLDGTLTLTNEVDNHCFVAALCEVLGTKQIETDWAKYRDVTDSGVVWTLMADRYGGSPRDRELEAVRERFLSLLYEELQRAGLGEREYPLASASDACSREAIMALAADRVAARWGVSGFRSIVYVGDGVWDVTAARRLGWHFVGIGSGERAERLRREGARCVIADYCDQGLFFNAITHYHGAEQNATADRPRE